MIFLIDAYNLMHAVGYLHASTPLNRMESSRRRLLDWLATCLASRPGDQFHVVFDAKTAPRASEKTVYRGIEVSFAFRESADDFLERLLKDAKRQSVTLVSNDTIIQAAASRYRHPFLSCTAFVDQLHEAEERAKKTKGVNAHSQLDQEEKPVSKTSDDELLGIFSQPPKTRRP